jgi:hypothetical protein
MLAMSMYMLFDATHASFDKVRSRFFWEGVGQQRNQPTMCKPKELGGLGILNTHIINIALMLKWLWKLYQNAEGLWVDLLRAKYLGDNDIFGPVSPFQLCSDMVVVMHLI